jgi:hypothetical protein
MFDLIIKTLEIGDLIGVSKEIDIAKGVNKLQTTWKGSWKQYKRKKAW